MDNLIFEGLIRQKNNIENPVKFDIKKTPRPKNTIIKQDTIYIPPHKKKIILEYNKPEELYLSGKIKPENNKIQQEINFIIPKTQEKEKYQNQIINLENIKILPKEKEPLQKENLESLLFENVIINEVNGKGNELNIMRNEKIKKENENQISHIDTIFIEQKETKSLIQEQIDELPIESEIRPENAIESIKTMKILKKEKPPNEIVNLNEEMFIQKKEIKDVPNKYNNNEIQKTLQINIEKTEKKPQNEIRAQESIFIPPKEKHGLIKENTKDLYIEGNKELNATKNFELLKKNKTNDIIIEGLKINEKLVLENKIISQEILLIPSKKKEPLIQERVKDLNIEGNALAIASNREKLLEDKINEIIFEGQKEIEKILPENEITLL